MQWPISSALTESGINIRRNLAIRTTTSHLASVHLLLPMVRKKSAGDILATLQGLVERVESRAMHVAQAA